MISDEGVWGEDPLPKKMFELVPMECCIFHSNSTQNISPDHVSVGYSFLKYICGAPSGFNQCLESLGRLKHDDTL